MGFDWDKLEGKDIKKDAIITEEQELIKERIEIKIKPEPVLKERKKRIKGKILWEEPSITKLMTAHELIFGVSLRAPKNEILDKIERDIPKLKELMKKQKS